jgi:lipid A ethanolaminephosphotransferase
MTTPPGRFLFVRAWHGRLELTVEQLMLAAALYWAVVANGGFLSGVLARRSWDDPATWGFGLAMGVLLVALHVLLMALVANRWTVKPLLCLMLPVAAAASCYIDTFGIYLDPSMLRNVLRTEPAEAAELLNPSLWWHLLWVAGLPMLLLRWVRVRRHPWGRATLERAGWIVAAAVVTLGAVLVVFQSFSSLMRQHKELRYLITPANAVWSTGRVWVADARGAARRREPMGLDAAPGASWAQRKRPMVAVLVVGETTRAANWGLDGYGRQTTPELARLPVVNFTDVTACGTNTEVSLPCMFAPVGRRDHDEARIRGQQSLLHVLARAGVAVHWRDNQSGCKGVCEGLPGDTVASQRVPALCPEGERCLDEGLIHDLDARLDAASGTQLWVFHMLGNHGPSYFRRYPPRHAQFLPDCRSDDLKDCPVEHIVNAYDNAVLYTDEILARAIRSLAVRADQIDSALLYVSDHGESLGENGLFLHGMPYAIAPQVQKKVPMVMWTSAGFGPAAGMADGCLEQALRRQAASPVAHDHLFHTLLGWLDVRTSLYRRLWDLSAACRRPGAP